LSRAGVRAPPGSGPRRESVNVVDTSLAHPAHVSCPEVAAGDPFVAAARSKARAERLAREDRGIALYEKRGADMRS
jgi:hypothetical protein